MSNNFRETYFYSSILDNGKLNEYGCGVKNINDSKEYYIYDSDSKNYVTVDKEQYLNYNEKMEKLEHADTPPISKKNCPLTQQQKQQLFFQKELHQYIQLQQMMLIILSMEHFYQTEKQSN